MFKNEDATKKIVVELFLSDGRALVGHIILPATSDLVRIMNNDLKYIRFESLDGNPCLIAKSAILEVASRELPKAVQLDAGDDTNFDPYSVLGLPHDSTPQDVRAAYLKVTKIYHPDIYANIAMPPEVERYLNAVFSRANLAYTMIKSGDIEHAA